MENWFKPGGTDTGLNFFYPGKNEEGQKLFVTGIACLAYGLSQYNEPWAKKKSQSISSILILMVFFILKNV